MEFNYQEYYSETIPWLQSTNDRPVSSSGSEKIVLECVSKRADIVAFLQFYKFSQ